MNDQADNPTEAAPIEGAENFHLMTLDCLRNVRENLDMLIETLAQTPDADQRVSTLNMAFNTWWAMAAQHRMAYIQVRGLIKQ